MNTTFKLGKVSIPVPGIEGGIQIEGLEIKVENYNLLEGLKVAKEMPSILAELKSVMEDDYTPDMSSLFGPQPHEEDEHDEQIPSFMEFMEQKLKEKQAQQAQQKGSMPKSLADLLAQQEQHQQPKSIDELIGHLKPAGELPEGLKKLIESAAAQGGKIGIKVVDGGSLEDLLKGMGKKF